MKVSENNSVDFKNLHGETDMNSIDLDNDSFSSHSYKNSFPFLPGMINIQSIN